jgi:hypothetical protein
MILELIEDYQKIITDNDGNYDTEIVIKLTDMLKHILDTKMSVINEEMAERRKKKEIDNYIMAVKGHINKLEAENTKLLETINVASNASNASNSLEMEFEKVTNETLLTTTMVPMAPMVPIENTTENIKKFEKYCENNSLLENMRTEVDRVSLGYSPVPPNFNYHNIEVYKKQMDDMVNEMVAKIEEIQIQVDSVVDKMSGNIGYNHSLIEQLNVKYTLLSNRFQEVEARLEKLETKRPMASEVPESIPYLKRPYIDANYANTNTNHHANQNYVHHNASLHPQREKREQKRNKEKYNKNKERNDLIKKQLKEMKDKKE